MRRQSPEEDTGEGPLFYALPKAETGETCQKTKLRLNRMVQAEQINNIDLYLLI